MNRFDERAIALRRSILRWYRRFGRDLPWRRTRDPYAVLVSEIMLAQTQAARVVPKFVSFLARFPTLQSLAAAPLARVLRQWSGLGYNGRAKRLVESAKIVRDEFGARVPAQVQQLRGLPGIGPYTAAAVACFASGARVPVVDVNVRRVLSRAIAGVDDAGETAARELARRMLPQRNARDWNQALMDVGALFCRAKPRCEECPARRQCMFFWRPRAAMPAARKKPAPFAGSRRYYRGRIVKALLAHRTLRFAELGKQVKPGFAKTDLPWLERLLHDLRRDGLVALDPRTRIARLP